MDIIQTVETAASGFWSKIVAWWNGTAVPTLKADEQELLLLLKPLFGAAEAAALQDLVVFVKGVLTQVQAGQDLATLEVAVLNALEAVGGQLAVIGKGLGSNVLQALIGLILAQLTSAAAASSAAQTPAPAPEQVPA
jgi:hypothetical protein